MSTVNRGLFEPTDQRFQLPRVAEAYPEASHLHQCSNNTAWFLDPNGYMKYAPRLVPVWALRLQSAARRYARTGIEAEAQRARHGYGEHGDTFSTPISTTTTKIERTVLSSVFHTDHLSGGPSSSHQKADPGTDIVYRVRLPSGTSNLYYS
ncbi:hypothetical protein P170DRAFT_474587 [Aspergillus steynii IBT 23096]|uniref:Uncharacterized protein n=1 Tax=Aspergillus steynii IBT 23096 TaxID=1392250 RepID=A0A2I2GDS8_9EURO|nr:uncharacterized protein P170DRAFT_474587 [Aspergillus steynii IBT 23096]PLB51038.1 hypothetical protein P170DRAFT_474587 [Aspergillus steynii IBT 23096]